MTAIAIANEWSARGKRWLYIWWPLIILALAGVVELNDSTINSQVKSYWSMGLLNTFYMVILAPICLALLFFVTFWIAGIGSGVDTEDRMLGAKMSGVILFLTGLLASLISLVAPTFAIIIHALVIIIYPTAIAYFITDYGCMRSLFAGVTMLLFVACLLLL